MEISLFKCDFNDKFPYQIKKEPFIIQRYDRIVGATALIFHVSKYLILFFHFGNIIINILYDILLSHCMERLKILHNILIHFAAFEQICNFRTREPFKMTISLHAVNQKTGFFAHLLMPPPDNHRILLKVHPGTSYKVSGGCNAIVSIVHQKVPCIISIDKNMKLPIFHLYYYLDHFLLCSCAFPLKRIYHAMRGISIKKQQLFCFI